MNPAPSVIVFTSISGAGYGLLALIGLAGWLGLDLSGAAPIIVSLILITAELVSSTFHLGRPDRAWRALSQWRSSWLSREGMAAILTYIPALFLLLAGFSGSTGISLTGLAATILAGVTVFCTAMIYASLKTVPAWNRPQVPAVYLAFSAASGALFANLLIAFSGRDGIAIELVTIVLLLVAYAIKYLDRQGLDALKPASTAASALGFREPKNVNLIEQPHQGENYVMREMAFKIGRKHAEKLERIMWLAGLVAPVVFLATAMLYPAGAINSLLALVSLVCGMAGILVGRWLFFATAEHKVALYYGSNSV